jgi:hypothetical protein
MPAAVTKNLKEFGLSMCLDSGNNNTTQGEGRITISGYHLAGANKRGDGMGQGDLLDCGC